MKRYDEKIRTGAFSPKNLFTEIGAKKRSPKRVGKNLRRSPQRNFTD